MKIKKNVKKLIKAVKKINWHILAVDVSKKEGLKKSLSIAQIKEVIKHTKAELKKKYNVQL